MVTLKDISKRCGCSVATVSKALNGMPDISEATTKHIRQIAEELGYFPNAAARTLKTNRSQTIGLLMSTGVRNVWIHEYFTQITAGIQDVMEDNGYDITPVNCSRPGIDGSYLSYCRHRAYDGVIIMNAGFDETSLSGLLASEIPVVTLEMTYAGRGAVLSDNTQGAGELVRYAYGKGHKRIAFIHGEDTIVTRTRLRSYATALDELGLERNPQYLIPALYNDPESAYHATLKLMALDKPPSCILYQDDYACIVALDMLRRNNIALPPNLSYAGYDGIRLSEIVNPHLTTYQQNSGAIGREAARMLLQAIRKGDDFEPRYVTLPGKLLPGESIREYVE